MTPSTQGAAATPSKAALQAGGQQAPAAPVQLLGAGSAKRILSEALTPPPQNALPGKATSLSAALQRSVSRAQRLAAVKTYWRLALGLADYHHALEETDFLASLAAPQTPLGQARLRAALAAARARQQEATLAAIAAQHDLAEVALRPETAGLPLPSDAPFVGRYRTRFETLFASRPVPAGLRRINETLPYYLNLVDARAESVHGAQQALDAAVAAYQAGQTGIATVLDAHTHLRDQRIAFLAAVRDYNNAIADYALVAAQPVLTPEETVSMLIETKGGLQSGPRPSDDTGPADGDRSANERSLPRTNRTIR